MTEYTPKTWEIKHRYVSHGERYDWFEDDIAEIAKEFDRWLNQERQAAFQRGVTSPERGQWWAERSIENAARVAQAERDRLAYEVWEEVEELTKDNRHLRLTGHQRDLDIAYRAGLSTAIDIIKGKTNE